MGQPNATFSAGATYSVPGKSTRSSPDSLGNSAGKVFTPGASCQPFPIPVRTLDALHLASIEFLRDRRQSIELASYDDRLLAAARALGIELWVL